METKNHRSNRNTLLAFTLVMLQSAWLKAEGAKGLAKKMGLSGSEMNSLYIIGGVLVMGIVGYIVYSIIEKNRKDDKPVNRPPVSHRHHHHHRVIKKSA